MSVKLSAASSPTKLIVSSSPSAELSWLQNLRQNYGTHLVWVSILIVVAVNIFMQYKLTGLLNSLHSQEIQKNEL
jgi:hypothetical protein